MDITKIDDLQQLKAMAFDEMVELEARQRNIQIIQARIAEINKSAQTEETE